jgi:hypothetical protein
MGLDTPGIACRLSPFLKDWTSSLLSLQKGHSSAMGDRDEEGRRLGTLANLAIIGAPPDPMIEQVCAIARTIFEVPFAYVNMVAETEAFIIAHQGLEICSTPREHALCNVTICQDRPVIVPDTLEDPRFRGNPLVLEAPKFRFYAGIPLAMMPDVRLGALCIADTRPRTMTAAQVASLSRLADIVVGQLAYHRNKQELARQSRDLARKQAMLSRSEQFAMVGGFEVDSTDGTMAWSDELHRLCGTIASEHPSFETFLDLFATPERLKLAKSIRALGVDGADIDLKLRMVPRTEPMRDVHVRIASVPIVVDAQRHRVLVAVDRHIDGGVFEAILNRVAEQVRQRLPDATFIPFAVEDSRRVEPDGSIRMCCTNLFDDLMSNEAHIHGKQNHRDSAVEPGARDVDERVDQDIDAISALEDVV